MNEDHDKHLMDRLQAKAFDDKTGEAVAWALSTIDRLRDEVGYLQQRVAELNAELAEME